MPSVFGNWTPNLSTNKRMQLSTSWTLSTITAASVSVVVTGEVRLHAGFWFYDSNNTFSQSGSLLGSKVTQNINISIPQSNGSQLLGSFSKTVPLGAGITTQVIAFSLTGVEYVGRANKAAVTAVVQIPARIVMPVKVSSLAVSRNGPAGTTDLKLTWPGEGIQEIQYARYDAPNPTWTHFSSGTTFESGVGLGNTWVPNGLYGFRVKRVINGLSSGWTESGNIWLTDPPVIPTSSSIARGANDAEHIVKWGHPGTVGTRQLIGFQIGRKDLSESPNIVIVSSGVANTTRAWTDTTTKPNSKYEYFIRAVGKESRYSTWLPALPPMVTTPAAAENLKITRSGSSGELSYVVNAPYATGHTILSQFSTNGGVDWSPLVAVAGHVNYDPTLRTRNISGLAPEKQWRFVVQTLAGSLTNNSTPSNVLLLLSKPLVPSRLGPNGYVQTGETVRAMWKHNTLDSTLQSEFELQWKLKAASWPVSGIGVIKGTTNEFANMAITANGEYEWRVRTRGSHIDWSDWSTTGVFVAQEKPIASIVAPVAGTLIEGNTLTITAGFFHATDSWSSWRAELSEVGSTKVLDTITKRYYQAKWSFGYRLKNNTSYKVELVVISGNGMESDKATATYPVLYALPPAPTLEAVWIEDEGIVSLGISNPVGIPPAVENRIERSSDMGETWQELGSGLPLNAGFSNHWVPLNATYIYRAFAVSGLESEAVSEEVTVTTTTKKVIWLGSMDGLTNIRLYYNLKVDTEYGVDVIFEQYYGDESQTPYYGPEEPVSIGVNARVTSQEDIAVLRKLQKQPLKYRSWDGQQYNLAFTSGGLKVNPVLDVWYDIGFSLEKIQN